MRLAFALAWSGLAACGLSVVGVGGEAVTDGSDAAPDVAAPTVDGDAPDVAPPILDAGTEGGRPLKDAGVPDSAAPGCTSTLDNFATVDNAKWRLIGASAAPGGGVQLTKNGSPSQVSGIWTASTMPLGSSVHVTVTFKDDIPPGVDDGEGIAIAWASGTGLGGTDKGLGICASSLDGVAALLYTEGAQRVQVATDINGDCQTVSSIPTTVGKTGTVELTLTKNGTTTATAGTNVQTVPAGTVPQTGFVGVTASTGSTQRSNFTITSINIESCP
jgi:hypothetical protein